MGHLIVVTGSARSGSSLVANVLDELGWQVPRPHIPIDRTNPKGFYEPQWLVNFHRSVLGRVPLARAAPGYGRQVLSALTARDREAARSWLSGALSAVPRVGLKDPRIAWFLSLWTEAGLAQGHEVDSIVLVRHPAEVVNSKAAAYGREGSAHKRALEWINTTSWCLWGAGSNPYVVCVDPGRGLGSPELARGLQPALRGRSEAEIVRVLERVIDPTLLRAARTWESVGAETVQACEDLYGLLVSFHGKRIEALSGVDGVDVPAALRRSEAMADLLGDK